MARSRITETTTQVQSDSGNILWSFIAGEQLEFEINLGFVANALLGYTFEAVVMEGDNTDYPGTPTQVKTGGQNTPLVVRVPAYLGTWNPASSYALEDVVVYNGFAYRRIGGAGGVDAATPNTSALWATTALNRIYVKFPSTLISAWLPKPNVLNSVKGFFEMSVTEPAPAAAGAGAVQRTWKPLRGLVEILFSPTDLVT